MKEWITVNDVDEDGFLKPKQTIKNKIRYWLDKKSEAKTPAEAAYCNQQLFKLYDLE